MNKADDPKLREEAERLLRRRGKTSGFLRKAILIDEPGEDDGQTDDDDESVDED